MSEEEYIEKVNHDPWYINNVPDEILIENPQICIDAIKADKYIFKKNLISDEVKIACPQICIYAVQNDPQLIEYVPEIVKRNNPKICLNAIKIDHNLVRFVPEIVKRNNPKICIDLVRDNLELLRYIPERVKKNNPQICIDAVKIYPELLEYVPFKVKKNNPQMCVDAVNAKQSVVKFVPEIVKRENPHLYIEHVKVDSDYFERISDEIKKQYPEICIEAVNQDINNFRDVPEEVKINNPQMCVDAVKRHSTLLSYVPEEVKINNPQMCIDATKNDRYVLGWVPESVQIENEQYFIDLVKRDNSLLKYLSKNIQDENPQFYIDLVKRNNYLFEYLSKNIQDANPQFCIDLVKRNNSLFEYLSNNVQDANSQFCIDLVKSDNYLFKYLSKNIQNENQQFCLDLVKEKPHLFFEHLSNEIKLENPQLCIDIVKNNSMLFKFLPESLIRKNVELCIECVSQERDIVRYIPEDLLDEHPEIVLEAIKIDGPDLFDYSLGYYYDDDGNVYYEQISNEEVLNHFSKEFIQKHPEFVIEVIKKDLNFYSQSKFMVDNDIRNHPKIIEYMFEDTDAIKRIREKSHFEAVFEDREEEFNERLADVFFHKMIKSIGLEETEKLFDVPDIQEEQIIEYGLDTDQLFDELYERKYTIKGDLGLVIDVFRNLDLRGYESKGKNVKFEIFKNLNILLENGEINDTETLIRMAIQNSGFEVNESVIKKMNTQLDISMNRLANERYDKVKGYLIEQIENNFETQQAPIERIIQKQIIENSVKNQGSINIEDILTNIESEILRVNEEGGYVYSPHLVSKKEDILQMTKEFLNKESIKNTLSKNLVTILREQKEKVGKGWIRKLQNIPVELSKEQFENLEKSLNMKIDSNYEARLKEGVDRDEAYMLLTENDVTEVLTFKKVELMFSTIKEPYSEEFKKYFKQHKKEFLNRPDVFSEFAKIHNSFDSIISKPGVINRYRSGSLTLDNILQIIGEVCYDNVKPGNERLAKIAAGAGLEEEYFDSAQRIYDITRKREGSTMPQVISYGKKYRGRILRADEALNLFAGDITACCQRFGDVGEGAMMHAATEKNGAIFIIEEIDEKGNVIRPIGQSWTWRNKTRMCFDNIEIKPVIQETLSSEDEKEIMDIYIDAAKQAIKTDEKVMTRLLKEGKITKEVFDAVTLREVTCGLNQYNDLVELENRVRTGVLNKSESIILPVEKDKEYKGYNTNKPWIDSSEIQISLAKTDRITEKEVENENIEVPVIYTNKREVDSFKGNDILNDDIEKVRRIEKTVYRKEQQILQQCESVDDVAECYDMDSKKLELVMSRDGDWYMIGEERENEYYIADLAMVGGLNSQKNEKVASNAKMATFEMAEKMYEKMIEMAKKGKNVRYEATRDTSYINTKNMEKKGLIEVISDEEDRFSDSDIEMNNVVITPNVEALEEELKKVRETLRKLREKELCTIKVNSESGEQSR